MSSRQFIRFRSALTAPIILQALALSQPAEAQSENAALAEGEPQEILVTAQRRAERLQDVPISITALSGQDLESSGITSTSQLSMVVPGLRVEATGAYVQPTIRGISTSVIAPTAEANIATYVDGVYQTTQISAIYELPDIQGVEVLKGPQGTLFGRNATGGAILINSTKPSFTEASGMVSAGYGGYNERKLKGMATVPVIEDRLAIGVSALYMASDGYTRDIYQGGRTVGGIKTFLLRGKIRFRPFEGADFTLTALRATRDDYTSLKQTNYRGNNDAAATLPPSQIASRPWEFGGNENPYILSEQNSISLRGDIEAGPGVLTTTTAYTHDKSLITSDTDNSALPTTYIRTPAFAKSFQQELIYATDPLGPVRFVAGLFYYLNRGGQDLNVNRNATTIYQRDEAESYAAFGEVSWDVTERLNLTGGLRFSHDNQAAFATAMVGNQPPPSVIRKLGEASWDAWTPRFSVRYKLSDRTTTYFTYSQGFKAGLFNTISFQPIPVNPEKIKAYEFGIKSDEIQDLSLTAAAFYYDYNDLQLPAFILTDGIPRQELRNAASSRIYGAELNANWRASEAFTLNLGLTYLDARYSDYPNAVINVPKPTGGNSQIDTKATGNYLNRSPAWSGNVTAKYEQETSLGRFDASATLFWSTSFYFESGNRVVQPSYALLNAGIGFTPKGSSAEFRVWGRNLTNAAVISGANISVGADSVLYGAPRTYGAEIVYRF